MDRQLAERMVGAACLLAVLVLVVPAILDGNPDSDAIITHPSAVDESLDLRTHTIRLDSDEREPPVPTPVQPRSVPGTPAATVAGSGDDAAAGPETLADEPGPAGALPEAAPQPALPLPDAASTTRVPKAPVVATAAPPSSDEPAATPGSGEWFVQLGSFSRRDNADRLVADLKRKGFTSTVLAGGGSSGSLFRVRAGSAADKGEAEALAARLAAAGFGGGRVGRK